MKQETGTLVRQLSRRALITVLALAFGLGGAGCLAVAVGAGAAGAVAFVRGELQVNLEAELDNTLRATNQAIQDLEFAKISEAKDALQANLIARDAADTRIEIRLNRVAAGLTSVRIRVGTFGNEQLSHTILDRIKANL